MGAMWNNPRQEPTLRPVSQLGKNEFRKFLILGDAAGKSVHLPLWRDRLGFFNHKRVSRSGSRKMETR